jgi:hypothetical protein
VRAAGCPSKKSMDRDETVRVDLDIPVPPSASACEIRY